MAIGVQQDERFRTTSWVAVQKLAAGGTDEDRRQMLELLIRRYWPPVYAHLRSKRRGIEDARELTQAFFVDVVIGRDLFRRADPRRGRLRTLLLTALDHFEIDQHRRRAAARRAVESACGHAGAISAKEFTEEEDRIGRDGSILESDAFERRWAIEILEETLRRAEAHFRSTGRERHWSLFEARVLRPAITGNVACSLDAQASDAGFDSGPQGAAAVQVVKTRIEAILCEVVSETLGAEESVAEEVAVVQRHLRA